MVNVQLFPLFRLPTLAYENVVDFLHLKEKIDLSATSRRSSQIIKRYIQLRKHKLMIFLSCDDYSARIYVYINRGSNSNIKKSNSWVYELGGDNNMIVDPTVRQITHMASVAPSASLKLKFSDAAREEAFVPLAVRLNLTLESVEFYVFRFLPYDNMYRWVFENCRHAQSLSYLRETTDEFTMDPDTLGSYSFKFLKVWDAPWITGNQLIKCFDNCKHIELLTSKLSAQEMNDFLTREFIGGSG